MKPGDKVKVTWSDGEIAIGFFICNERGYAVFEDDKKERFVALIHRDATTMEVIKK